MCVCAATLCSYHWPGVQPAGEELLLTDGRLAELAKGCVRSLESWEELVERLQLAHVLPSCAIRLGGVLLPLQRCQAGVRVDDGVPLHLRSRRDSVVGGGELVLRVRGGAVLRLYVAMRRFGVGRPIRDSRPPKKVFLPV